MAQFKPVTISKGSFAFCRYTVALLLWAALILQLRVLVLVCFLIFLSSYILRVKRAPLIIFYTYTADKLFPLGKELVDENGIRFAHLVGTIVGGLCCLILYFVNPLAGWILTVLLAVLNTSAAFGFCSALKLYNCMAGGSCCRVGRTVRGRIDV